MVYIILFIISVIGDVVILNLLPTLLINKLILGIISGCILMIVLIMILNTIYEIIQNQAEDWYKIEEHKDDIEKYSNELEEYKEHMEHNLIPACQKFEAEVMKSVRDSKLLAAVLKEGAYPRLTIQHANVLRQLLLNKHGAGRAIAKLRRQMLARQECNLFSYGWFIPAHLRIQSQGSSIYESDLKEGMQ